MEVRSLFLNNYNIIFFLTLFLLLSAFILLVIGHFCLCKKLTKAGKYLIKPGLLTLLIFSSFNISFAAGIQWKYASTSQDFDYIISSICLYLSLILIMAVIVGFLFSSSKYYGEFKRAFKKDCVSQVYIILSLAYRVSLGFYISLENEYEEGTFLVLSFSLFFMLYNIVNLPFSCVFQSYRANIIHISQFVILMVSNYYRGMKSTTHLSIKSRIHSPAILVLVCLSVCLIVSFIMLLI